MRSAASRLSSTCRSPSLSDPAKLARMAASGVARVAAPGVGMDMGTASGGELLAPSLPLPPPPPPLPLPPVQPPPSAPPPWHMDTPSGVEAGGAARRGGRLRVVSPLPIPLWTDAPGLSAGDAGGEDAGGESRRGDRLRGVSGMASPPHGVLSAPHGEGASRWSRVKHCDAIANVPTADVSTAADVPTPPPAAYASGGSSTPQRAASFRHAALCSCATWPSSAYTRVRREAHSACAACSDLLLTAARTASSSAVTSAAWFRNSSRERRAALSWREVAAEREASSRLSRRRESFASICACSRTSRSCRCWRSIASRYSGSASRLLRDSSVLPRRPGDRAAPPRYTALYRASAACCMCARRGSCPRARKFHFARETRDAPVEFSPRHTELY